MIYINNPEIKSNLCSDLIYFGKEPQIFFRRYVGLHEHEKLSLNSIWQIEHFCDENFGDCFYSHDNSEDMLTPKKTTRALKLRHFLTGRLITLSEGFNKKDFFNVCLGREKPPGFDITKRYTTKKNFEGSSSEDDICSSDRRKFKLYFENVIIEESYLRHKSLVYLKSKDSYLTSSRIPELDRVSILPIWEQKKQIKPLSNLDCDEKKKIILFKKSDEASRGQNILILNKINKKKIKELLFIRSMIPKLLHFTSLFKHTRWDLIKYHTYLEISELLKKIVCFLYGKSTISDQAIWTLNEQPLSSRQSMIKNLGFLEIFTDIIYLSDLYIETLKTNKFWLFKNLQMNHIVLRYSIQEYRPSELYCCQWITLILDQAVKEYGDRNNHAGETLTELINNNKKVLETKIEDDTITKILNFLVDKGKNSKYVTILSALCICKDKPMIKNQKELSEKILNNPEILQYFLFNISIGEDRELYIENHALELSRCSLSDFKQVAKISQSNKLLDYFLSTMSFFADLCYQRNNFALQILQEKFPFEIFIKVFKETEIRYDVKTVFCKLFIHLWVDTMPFNKVDFDINVVNWDDLEDSIMIPSSRYNTKKFIQVKVYILKFLTTETHRLTIKSKEGRDKMAYLIILLKLCKKMLVLGFFEDLYEINTMVKQLKSAMMSSFKQYDTLQWHKTKLFTKNDLKKSGTNSKQENNPMNKENLFLLKEFRVSICRFLEIILNLDNMIKKKLIIFRLKNFITSSIKKDDFIPKSVKGEFNQLSERAKRDLRDIIEGSKIYLSEENYSEFVMKIGEMITEISIRENLIDCIRDKELVFSLLALSYEDDLEVKNYSIKLIFNLFSNNERLTNHLITLTILKKRNEDRYKELKGLKEILIEVLDYMVSYRTIQVNEISTELLFCLNDMIEATVIREHKFPKKMLMEPEGETLPLGIKFSPPTLNPFQDLIVKYSESVILEENKQLMRGTGIINILLKILDINSVIVSEKDGLSTEVLDKILYIFVLLIKDNEENQALMLRKFKILVNYMDGTLMNDNSIFLLSNLMRNNKKMLFNQDNCFSALSVIKCWLKDEKTDHVKRNYIFHMIGLFGTYKGKAIKRNQNMIFNHFIKKGENYFYHKLRESRYVSTLKNFSNNYYDERKNKVNIYTKIIVLDKRVDTILSILDLINQCNKGSNQYVMNISKKVIFFDHIKQLIKLKLPSYILLIMIKFIQRVYMENVEDLDDYIFEEYLVIFTRLIDVLNNADDLNLLELGEGQVLSSYYLVTFSDCFDCNYYNTQLNFELLKAFKDILRLGLGHTKTDFIETQNKKFEIFGRLLLQKVCSIYEDSSLDIQREIHQIVNCIATKTPVTFLKRSREFHKEMIHHIENHKIYEAALLKKMKSEEERREENVDEVVKDMIKRYSKTVQFHKNFNSEFNELVEMILEKNKDEETDFIIEYESFVQSISIYLGIMNKASDEKNVIEGLRVLQKLLEHTRNAEENQTFDQKETKLVKLGIIDTIFKLFEKGSVNIQNECVILLIELMKSRNKITKEVIIESFNQSYGVSFFNCMIIIMRKSVETVVEIMNEVNDNKLRMMLKTEIGLDKVDRLGVDMEVSTINFKMKLIKRVYKFMRMVAEGSETGKCFLRGTVSEKQTIKAANLNIELDESEDEEDNFIEKEIRKKNTNIITFSVELFSIISKAMNVNLVEIGISILRFLLEVIDGPSQENQNIIIKARFLECVKFIVSIHTDNMERMKRGFDENYEKLQILAGCLLQVVRGLIEANHKARPFITELRRSLTIEFLILKIQDDLRIYFKDSVNIMHKLKGLVHHPHYDSKFENIFNTFFVLKLLYFSDGVHFNSDLLTEEQRSIYNYFDEHSGSIEIIFKDKIYVLYHIIHPIFRNFKDELKEDLMDNVQRDAPKKKVQDYLNRMPMIFDILTYETKLKSNKYLSFNYFEWTELICLILCVSINSLMMIFFKKETYNGEDAVTDRKFDESHPIFQSLRLAHFIATILKTLTWFMSNGRIEIMKRWRHLFESVGEKMRLNEDYKNHTAEMELTKKSFSDLKYAEKLRLLEIHLEMKNLASTYKFINYSFFQLHFVTSSTKFKFLLFYIILTYFAYTEQIMFFYSVLVLDIINYDSTLMNVTKSITLNYEQLGLTGLLCKKNSKKIFQNLFLIFSRHANCIHVRLHRL